MSHQNPVLRRCSDRSCEARDFAGLHVSGTGILMGLEFWKLAVGMKGDERVIDFHVRGLTYRYRSMDGLMMI